MNLKTKIDGLLMEGSFASLSVQGSAVIDANLFEGVSMSFGRFSGGHTLAVRHKDTVIAAVEIDGDGKRVSRSCRGVDLSGAWVSGLNVESSELADKLVGQMVQVAERALQAA